MTTAHAGPGQPPARAQPAAGRLPAPTRVHGDPGTLTVAHRAAQERCEKTDLIVSACAHCTGRYGDPELLAEMGDPAGGEPPTPLWGPWTDARFPGRCAGCQDPIEPGDRIRAAPAGGWACEICGGGS